MAILTDLKVLSIFHSEFPEPGQDQMRRTALGGDRKDSLAEKAASAAKS
jgi:hypothetical protein